MRHADRAERIGDPTRPSSRFLMRLIANTGLMTQKPFQDRLPKALKRAENRRKGTPSPLTQKLATGAAQMLQDKGSVETSSAPPPRSVWTETFLSMLSLERPASRQMRRRNSPESAAKSLAHVGFSSSRGLAACGTVCWNLLCRILPIACMQTHTAEYAIRIAKTHSPVQVDARSLVPLVCPSPLTRGASTTQAANRRPQSAGDAPAHELCSQRGGASDDGDEVQV